MFGRKSLKKMSTEELYHAIACNEGSCEVLDENSDTSYRLRAYYAELRRRGVKKFTVPSNVVPGRGRRNVRNF